MVKDSKKTEEVILKEAIKKVQKAYNLRVNSIHRIGAFLYKVRISVYEFILTCGTSASGTWYKLRHTEDIKRSRSIQKLLKHFGKHFASAVTKIPRLLQHRQPQHC